MFSYYLEYFSKADRVPVGQLKQARGDMARWKGHVCLKRACVSYCQAQCDMRMHLTSADLVFPRRKGKFRFYVESPDFKLLTINSGKTNLHYIVQTKHL